MSLRVGILTGRDVRHRYFVHALAQRFDVVTVGYQNTGYVPADVADRDGVDPKTAALVRRHFAERDFQELTFFGHAAEERHSTPQCTVRGLTRESLNSAETVAWLGDARVDVVVVYGTDLIKPPLLDRFAGRLINMHLGLSPYYRGTATNFYPLVNGEPEYVGATVHLIDAGIDTGPILHQVRPDITADDMPHTVGCKAIVAGVKKVLKSLREFETGDLVPVGQWPVEHPRLYLRRDYQPSHVVRLYERIDEGLIPRYVERRATAEASVRIVP